jgi:hypothetical protein
MLSGLKLYAILGAAVAIAGFLAFIATGTYLAGKHAAQVASLEDALEATKKTVATRDQAAKADQEQAAADEAEIAALETQLKELTDGIKNGDCLSADDVERLRKLWHEGPANRGAAAAPR